MNQIMTTADPNGYSRRVFLAAAGLAPKAVTEMIYEPGLSTADGRRLGEGKATPVGSGED
ncbi:MAG: hypothetical protein M0009_16530 [Deltaproteobacteria bacterium]|nr:hypothetical protein [Deltaproteobacteria bacterium]